MAGRGPIADSAQGARPSAGSLPAEGGAQPSRSDPVVLFDAECRLCTASARFIRTRDDSATFRLTPLQSPSGQRLMRAAGLDPGDLTSLVLFEAGQAFTHSEAALRIASRLGGIWKALSWLRFVPRGLRDCLYLVVARNRHRLSGRR